MTQRWRNLLDSGKIVSFRRAAILAILIVLIRLALLYSIQDRETLLLIDDVIFAIGSGLAAIGLLYGAYNSIGQSRKAWMVLATAQIFYAFGDASWAVIEAGLHQNPFPSLADFWYLAFYPIFTLGIFLLPAESISSRERIKFLLDAGIAVAASVFLFWTFMIAPIIASNEAVDFGLVISVAYPIMDLIVLAALIELIFRKLSFTGSKPHFFLAFGLVIALIADVIFSIQTQQGTYVSSSLLDTLWLISYMLFWLAGVAQANSEILSQPAALKVSYNKIAEWAQYLPYLAIGATYFLLIWGYENTRFISYSVLTGFIAVVIGLVFIRQKVTLDERNQLLTTTLSQIQELNQADEALSKSEQEKAAILDGLRNVSVEYLDPQMRIVWLNSAVQKHLGLSNDETKGKRCFEVIQGLKSPCPGCTALKALLMGESQDGELITPNGKTWISSSNLIKDANGDLAGVVHVAVNITERKISEEALQESENRYKAIFENTGTATVIIEDNTIISLANAEFGKLAGYGREEIEGKISWTEFVVKEDLERMLKQHKLRRTDTNAALKSYEFQIKDKNGNTKDILLNIDMIPGTKKSIASLLDITDRDRMEEDLRESKEQYKILAESSQDMIYVISRDDKIEYVNGSAARGLNRKPEEIVGGLRSSFFPSDVADRQKLHLKEVFDIGLPVRSEDVMIVGGTEIWQDTHLIPLKADDEVYAVLGISRDITEHKRSEEMLKASVAEKELLLKEVHHRVKNNLQMISALFYLQSLNFTDENILKVFRDGQDRIKSIALIHESLYKSHNLGKVDFNEYIRQLVSYLSQSYGDILGKVNFKVNTENIFLNINTAIPCGMIINELISNSLKHAFPDGRIGEICIDISSEDGNFKLVVSDNGIGFKDELNIKESKTLGFQLIETLVKQIGGNMSLDMVNGTKYEIHFSEK